MFDKFIFCNIKNFLRGGGGQKRHLALSLRLLTILSVLLSVLIFSCDPDIEEKKDQTLDPLTQILNTWRFLPSDPKNMSDSDREFHRTKKWIVMNHVSTYFGTFGKKGTPKEGYYYRNINYHLSNLKYFIHTREFAEEVLKTVFVLTKGQNRRSIQVVDIGLQFNKSYNYKTLNTSYHINPLEVLLVLRNMHYKLNIAISHRLPYYYSAVAYLGRLGQFVNIPSLKNGERDFENWDPIKHGQFKPAYTVWFSSRYRTILPAILIHEVLHNWGYSHPKNREVPGQDVPNGIEGILYRTYNKQFIKRAGGKVPIIYDIQNTANLTDKFDEGKPK